jgi:hypothetical protein
MLIAIITMFGLKIATHYGGESNPNTNDAQKKIHSTFENLICNAENSNNEFLVAMCYEYGVPHRAVVFGDPFHKDNLSVTHASIAAFSDVEKGKHTQVHHCQLLETINDLHNHNSALSQVMMDEVILGSGHTVQITKKHKRVQCWLVNQRSAKRTLKMFETFSKDGTSCLIE